MAIGEAWQNIRSNYRFHASLRGGRARRLAYLTVYYVFFIVLRWGDRHLRALNWLKRLGLSDLPVEVEVAPGFVLDLDLHTAFDPLYSIIGDEDYERVAGFRPAPGQTVMDLGANLGIFAARAATLVGPTGKVIAVEPHPDNFRRLEGNALRNQLTQLDCVQAAAGDREGTVELFVHERGINHSLVRGSGRSLSVPMKTVDAIVRERGLTRLDLLKIDIEGVVPAALRGAAESIMRFHPRIAIERDTVAENEGVDALLTQFGYEWRDWRGLTYAWKKL